MRIGNTHDLQRNHLLKKSNLIISFIILYLIAACSNQPTATIQPKLTIPPTFIPIPTMALEPLSTAAIEDISIGAQSIISFYNERSHKFVTLRSAISSLVKDKSLGYRFDSYSLADHISIAITFPLNFQVSKYNISQALNASTHLWVKDATSPSAIFRDLPVELNGGSEDLETAGEACDQFISGQLSITQKQPVQGNFQFTCQFQDGQIANVAGIFSQ